MGQNLVIVESPAKARTIQGFLGKDFIVKSSFGHIRDLPSKGLNIDIENKFKPIYQVPVDKKKIVSELKKLAKSNEVWLASDEDREGEAIAWHLAEILSLDLKKTKRIVFHEITKSAIQKAISTPRSIDLRLVDAQQARRVLDRLVGYELSPVLWKKIKTGLSAGRVQSVAVRLIVEREREINDWISKKSFKIIGVFKSDTGEIFDAELNIKPESNTETISLFKDIKDGKFIIKSITSKKGIRQPSAPFTTSSLQQEAARKLGYSVSRTMVIAQRLYESGQITYMRTDSTLLSNQALDEAEKYIKTKFSDKYYRHTQYKTKNSSAQESHEAIRPTNFNHEYLNDADDNLNKLYRLIWQRTVASQMSPAVLKKTELRIDITNKNTYHFIASGEIIEFKGFLEVYKDKNNDKILPNISEKNKISAIKLTGTEIFSKSPARYSEASLVKKLESLGIGRPSTYAPTISNIQQRGYIEKANLEGKPLEIQKITLDFENKQNIVEEKEIINVGADKNKLIPTPIANVATDFLVKNFSDVLNYEFTAKIEEEFDKIAAGKENWFDTIDYFYKTFHPLIEKSEQISRKEASQARLIGVDPISKKNIYARFGKYGPMLQKGENEDEEKPIFTSLPSETTIETVKLEDALKMFSLPRNIGKTKDGDEIIANIGRFGPYIKIKDQFISIKPLDPHLITEKEAIELYKEKISADKAKNLKIFSNNLKIINGPYGPYITNGKKNAKISKDIDPLKITEEEATELINKSPDKKKFKRKFKRKAKK